MAHIAVFGLGKLGCPLAAVLASTGHDVTGVDCDPGAVLDVNEGRSPVYEPGVRDLILQSGAQLRATVDGAAAVDRSDVSFVIVPTPSQADGTFSLDVVLPVVDLIGQALRRTPRPYHLVVITSTVMPGSMGGPIRQALEQASGLRLGHSLGLCYNPEFVALGTVIRDTVAPDLVLIGESDRQAGERLVEVLTPVYRATALPAVHRMTFVNAELAKIALNTFITTKISYANMLARMCERLPGASVDDVTSALGADSRIGPRYLRGAVGYGGPCFPRDNLAFMTLAQQLGTDSLLADATDRINRRQATWLADLCCRDVPPGGRVSILGLAYKPDSTVCEESAGLNLALELLARGVAVSVYDPAAMAGARLALGDRVCYHESARACLAAGAVAVVTVPWPEFSRLDGADFGTRGPQVVVDCWRILDPHSMPSNVHVVALGMGPTGASRP